jgi:DNA-binding transcriptional LysR family regulator
MLLNEMEIFYHVVSQQSFSKAAKRLNFSKSFISKSILKLEQHLNIRLLTRSTRKLTLTEAGERFFNYAATVVQESEKGYLMISELQGKPAGRLKISVPPAVALHLIAPVFSDFLSQYPEVILDVRLENQLVDLVKEGYALALRSATLETSNLIAQKIYTVKNILCATKRYLHTYGTPKTPHDLLNHNYAVYSDAKSPGKIRLRKEDYVEIIHLKGNLVTNHLELIKKLLLNNTCAAVLPEFMIKNELKKGDLIPCLEDYSVASSNLYAIYPEKEFMLPKLSLFLELLKKHLI